MHNTNSPSPSLIINNHTHSWPPLELPFPSAPNAPSKTPSTKDTSSSSIDYIPKSPTSSTSPSPNGYLNPSTSPPPRVSPPPPTQDNASMDITLTLSPNTPLDVQFDTPSPSPPIIAHPIPWNFLEAHEAPPQLAPLLDLLMSSSPLKTRSLVEFLSTDLPTTYKGLMEKTYTWIDAKEIATNEAPNDYREGFDKFGTYIRKKRQSSIHGQWQLMQSLLRALFPQVELVYQSTSSRFKNPPCGLLIEHSWPLGEVPLEVTIGENPYTRTLNFVIVRSDSPHNLLLGRTAMQKMGIVVSIIHATIKFHTPYRIDTVPSSYESNKIKEGEKKIKETILEAKKDVLICVDAEEKVVVNDKYPEQTVTIGNLLSISLRKKLQDLLRSNVDVFIWTYSDITNEYKHIKLVKQKKRGLGPDCNEVACKEVYELTKARIL
ncbi:hypothetical protein Tco_1102201 [Tanacetum coccineum]